LKELGELVEVAGGEPVEVLRSPDREDEDGAGGRGGAGGGHSANPFCFFTNFKP